MTDDLTALQVVQRYGIYGRIIDGPNTTRDADGWEHYAMTVRLNCNTMNGRPLEVPWRMGLGLDIGEFTGDGDRLPAESVARVIYALGQDLPIRDMDYPEFADEYGMWDQKGYRTWEAARDLSRKVYAWCQSEQMVDDLTYAQDLPG